MEIDDLEPCPFCGETHLDIEDFHVPKEHFESAIVCRNCGAVGPSFVKGRHQAIEPVRMKALAAWNDRPKARTVLFQVEKQWPVDDSADMPDALEPDERSCENAEPAGDQAAEGPDSTAAEPIADPDNILGPPFVPPCNAAEVNTLTQQLHKHIEGGVSINHVAAEAGTCWATVRNVLDGGKVSPVTEEKIRKYLESQPTPAEADDSPPPPAADTPPEAAAEPNDAPTAKPAPAGKLPMQPSPEQAAAYLQKTVAAWMRALDYNHDKAATEIGIRTQLLLNILQCHLPMTDVLQRLAKAIPELRPDLEALKRARKMKLTETVRAASW